MASTSSAGNLSEETRMCLQRQAITDNPEWAFQRRRSRATAERSRASLADQGARAGSAPAAASTLSALALWGHTVDPGDWVCMLPSQS